MGKRLVIEGAEYGGIFLDFKSTSFTYTLSAGVLTTKNNSTSSSYQWGASESANELEVKMSATSPASGNSVVIGRMLNGNAAILLLSGTYTGAVYEFNPSGVQVGIDAIYTMPAPKPNVLKGSFVKVTKITGGVNISYSGYSQNILFSSIPNFSKGVIGVIATGTVDNIYDVVL